MWHNQNSMQALGFTLREIADLYNSREGNKSVDFFDLRYWFVFSCVNYSKISVHMFNAAQESPPTRDDWAQSARTNVELATAVMSEALELTWNTAVFSPVQSLPYEMHRQNHHVPQLYQGNLD